jgi:hypothetical protein
VEDLSLRLSSDGVAFDPVELDEALVQLTDCGLVVHVQKAAA